MMPVLSVIAAVALAAEPRLPVPAYVAPPTYPPAALAEGREASVLLELDIGVTGDVIAARVVEPAGDGFDEAARQAMLASRFDPALDERGEPAAARIQFRVRFTAALAPKPSITGNAGPGTEIVAIGPEGARSRTVADESGAFTLSGLPAGTWELAFQAAGMQPETATVLVEADKLAEVQVKLRPPEAPAGPEFSVVVTAKRPTPEVTVRSLSSKDLAFLPGSQGDVVKAVQNLPGVARPPLGIGQLIIRGTAPEDSLAFLDGTRIPIVFHFAGLTTVVNGDIISDVAFVPGNASVRYGRHLGGLIDIRTAPKVPAEDKRYVSVDLYQATGFVQQRIGKKDAIYASIRRSYIDAVLTPLLSQGASTVRAPRYYDGQLRYVHEWPSGGVTEGLFTLSNDAFKVVGKDDPSAVQIGLQNEFWRARVQHRGPIGDGVNAELSLAAGPDKQSFQFRDDGLAYERTVGVNARAEVSRAAKQGFGFRFGFDFEAGRDSYLYDVPRFGAKEEGAGTRFAPAFYAEVPYAEGGLIVTPGLRVDSQTYAGITQGFSVDPRISARYSLGRVSLVAGTGRYSRLPTLRQLLPEADGNPDLRASYALQTSFGAEYKPLDWLDTSVIGFYNTLNALVVGREDRLRFFSGPPPIGPLDTGEYANDATGRVCGVEALARVSLDDTTALASLTLSNSVREKRPGQGRALFVYDQPVVLNVLASQKLPRGWRVGSRFRYGSGNPFTPVVNRFYDLGSRSFLPIYGEEGSDRLRPFRALDLRIDKTWDFAKWDLTFYVDIQNVTYAKNVEVMGWTDDYSAEDPITGLPPTPAFGFKGEF
jgi:TonB family protein